MDFLLLTFLLRLFPTGIELIFAFAGQNWSRILPFILFLKRLLQYARHHVVAHAHVRHPDSDVSLKSWKKMLPLLLLLPRRPEASSRARPEGVGASRRGGERAFLVLQRGPITATTWDFFSYFVRVFYRGSHCLRMPRFFFQVVLSIVVLKERRQPFNGRFFPTALP